MTDVKFSVVIPTRERADTLRFALHTCLDQAFDDYEIIVSDNFSSPATKAVVDEAASAKLRYVRTAEPVAMSNNWEFGVSHARGEYVLLIGDDDGLLPHALPELDRLTRAHRPKALRWNAAFYTWPTIALEGQANYLQLPLGRTLTHRDAASVIRATAEFREFYTELPMLYNSVVHRDVLDELRRRTGRVFPHPIPDVYSGFAIAHVAETFLTTTAPMSISGQSKASNGIAKLFNRGKSEIDREFDVLNASAGLQSESTVPDLPVYPHVPVADSFAFAKRVLFPDLNVQLDRKALAQACVDGARVTADEWPTALAAVRAALADVSELQQWFDAELGVAEYRPPAPIQLRSPQMGFVGTHLNLDAAAFGVTDVAGAARLCENVLQFCGRPINYDEPNDDRRLLMEQIVDLTQVCNERESIIRDLQIQNEERERAIRGIHAPCEERERIIRELQIQSQEREGVIRRVDAQLQDLCHRLNEERRWSLKRPLRIAKRILGLSRAA